MDFIINRKTLITMLFVGLTLLGVVSYNKLPVELFPNAQLPTLFVMVTAPLEMDPSYIESQAIVPMEGAIGTLEGIEKLESTISQRSGTIIIYYEQGADLKYASLKLQEKVNLTKASLPEGFMVNVVKVDLESISGSFMQLQVRGEGSVDRIRNIADREIKPEMENVDGIAGVEVFGGRENSIEIRLDEEACRSFGITIGQVRNILSQGGGEKVFAGTLTDGGQKLFVNIRSEYNDVTDIGNLIVKQQGKILLKDVAEIFFGVKEESSYSRVNGMEAVTISLVNDSQANLIDLSHEVTDLVEKLNKVLAQEGVEVVIQSNSAEVMENNINQIINLALIGGLLAVIILWFFLRNIRLVFIISLSIPISVYIAFNFFYAWDISINSLTLVGMALAIGMLIDNSVVVLENIYRLASQGMNPDDAVKKGTMEVWRSIFAATLTTITVFVPFVFSSNFLVKMIGKNIGVSIVSTLAVSLVVALLFIPMATHAILKMRGGLKQSVFKKLTIHNRLIQGYYLTLKASMRNPAGTVIGSLVVFFAALLISLALSISSTEEVETSTFSLSVTMPGGSTLEKTDLVVAEIEQRLEAVSEKQDIISRIQEESATVTVNLQKDWNKMSERSLPEIKNDINEKVKGIADAEITMEETSSSGSSGGGGSGGGSGGVNPGSSFTSMLGIGAQRESVVLKGQDFESMRSIAEDLKLYIEDLSTIMSVNLNIQNNRPEVHLLFDMETINRNDLTLGNVTSSLSSFGREYSSGSKFIQKGEEYDIMIKYADKPGMENIQVDKTIDDLKKLEVTGSSGNILEMEELANIVFASGMGSIFRENQEKRITVTYRFNDEINNSKELLDAARIDIENLVSNLSIPPGIAIEVIHDENELADFYGLIGIAFLLIFMILAAVFESLTTPVVLMFSIPLAGLGSLIALILTNNSLLNANTLTGFLILIGVVVNNGIILIDYANQLRKEGHRMSRALMMAGIARVRPILITAGTTIVALMPLAMGQAEYVSAIGASFAITVIGGLTLSSLLTLLFIPTFYSGLEGAIDWLRSLKWYTLIIQGGILAIMIASSFLFLEKFLWQLILTIVSIILVPAASWFIMYSLTKASETIIEPGVPITIKLQSLVKIYDRPGRFLREWESGKKIRERLGLEKNYDSWREMDQLVWQLPLFSFLIYFTYFFLEKNFWIFLFSVGSWFALMAIWSPFETLLTSDKRSSRIGPLAVKVFKPLIFWVVPVLNLVMFQLQWANIPMVLIVAVLWLGSLIVYTTGNWLSNNNVDIYRLEGKRKGIRRLFFRFVQSIPALGKKKKPFRALNSVSLEIETGMFGLLGPNGAGKTTMMRIICGILEQSYGKIWVNGLDTQEKREELQGLIGYLPQEFGTYENMSAHDYLHYQAMLKGITNKSVREERVKWVLESVGMADRSGDKIGSYSGGMKQRIGIAQILLHLPRILVVDEPTAGLDPRERIRFRNLLVELSQDRIVIFSTHIIEDISSSCQKVAVLNKGDLVYLGKPIDMASAAEGAVWQFEVPTAQFRNVSENHLVVHHMSVGNMVKVRCISGEKPAPDAINVTPNLEDAYLWLLRKKRENDAKK